MEKAAGSGHVFRTLALMGVSFVLFVLVACVTLTVRGREEIKKSDAAFHSGDLRAAIVHAKAAALAYVPGSEHVLAAYARLEAIAKGAEAEGNADLGRLAWETLRSVHARTQYPGRPKSAWEAHAQAGLERIDAAKLDQQK